MNNGGLTYLEITSLASQLKSSLGKLEELMSILKDEDYVRIGDGGDVWTGDVATMAKQTFEELVVKFPDFVDSVSDYADYLVSVVAVR